MSDPYERVKGGRLAFKGGEVAVSSKAIAKKKKKQKKKKAKLNDGGDLTEQLEGEVAAGDDDGGGSGEGAGAGPEVYTIDAAKKKKYEDLFPVEARKFGYDPKMKEKAVEDALDDRVKKKADRYCK